MFRFGCGHVTFDEAIHEAQWGARLIYSEVAAGGSGVVWDRQTPDGEKNAVESLFPVINRALVEFRKPENLYRLTADSRGELCWREGPRLVVMSPQGSYGYLYITALLEKHEGETKLGDFEGKINDWEFPRLGNWPPEVVEKREAAERKREHEAAIGSVVLTSREARWARRKVWSAKTERGRKMAEKKADAADVAFIEARDKASAAGFTEAEIDQAARGY